MLYLRFLSVFWMRLFLLSFLPDSCSYRLQVCLKKCCNTIKIKTPSRMLTTFKTLIKRSSCGCFSWNFPNFCSEATHAMEHLLNENVASSLSGRSTTLKLKKKKFSWILSLLVVRQSSHAISRKTNEPNLKKRQKNLISGPFGPNLGLQICFAGISSTSC